MRLAFSVTCAYPVPTEYTHSRQLVLQRGWLENRRKDNPRPNLTAVYLPRHHTSSPSGCPCLPWALPFTNVPHWSTNSQSLEAGRSCRQSNQHYRPCNIYKYILYARHCSIILHRWYLTLFLSWYYFYKWGKLRHREVKLPLHSYKMSKCRI